VGLSIDWTKQECSGAPILNVSGKAVGIVVVGAKQGVLAGERKNERLGGRLY